MKCIDHPEADAASSCARCGAGLCHECANGSSYQIDNKPLCRKCNYAAGTENDRIFQAGLKAKKIKMGFFAITFAIGLIAFLAMQIVDRYSPIVYSVITMLFFWGLGFIGNFFDAKPDTRNVKTQVKDAISESQYPVSTFLGKILGFFVQAVTSPIQIIALFISIKTIKKQIVNNNAILSELK